MKKFIAIVLGLVGTAGAAILIDKQMTGSYRFAK